MLQQQTEILLSPYSGLYDILISKDNILRRLKEMVDFSFVLEELSSKYSPRMGRCAIAPERLFKLLLLKDMYELSDVKLVERLFTDMSFKFFLDMAPEDPTIDSSTLTKFRKLRLKDVKILDMLIDKTMEIAVREKVIKPREVKLIVDATHTSSRYNSYSPVEMLYRRSRRLQKTISEMEQVRSEVVPTCSTKMMSLEEEIEFSKQLIAFVEAMDICEIPRINTHFTYLQEAVEDVAELIEEGRSACLDKDARLGHKSPIHSFNGYKTHLAMDDESRLITAAVVTTGEVGDGKFLPDLLEKTERSTDLKVVEIIGDTAYSSDQNLKLAESKSIKLVSSLHPLISNGARPKEKQFEFNKDAGLFVCHAGHLAMRVKGPYARPGKQENPYLTYFFDVEKCKVCKLREGCYNNTASKIYTVSVKSTEQTAQMEYQQTEEFKTRRRCRYKIEAKNAELKCWHRYRETQSAGINAMTLQGAMAIFSCNLKRILKIKYPKNNLE